MHTLPYPPYFQGSGFFLYKMGALWDSALMFYGLCFYWLFCVRFFLPAILPAQFLSRWGGSRCQPWDPGQAKMLLLAPNGYGVLSVPPHVSLPTMYYSYFHKHLLHFAELGSCLTHLRGSWPWHSIAEGRS